MIISKLCSLKYRLYITGSAYSCHKEYFLKSVLGFHLGSVEECAAFQHVFNVGFGEARQFEAGYRERDCGGVYFACFHWYFLQQRQFYPLYYLGGLFIYRIHSVLVEPLKKLIKSV